MGRRADQLDKTTREILASIDVAEDPRWAWAQVRERIDTLRQTGSAVPVALIRAERHLMADFMAESQGR